MALRDKLRQRVAGGLEPGEQVQQVFMTQTGLSPLLVPLIGALIAALVNKYYVIAVTDRGVLMFRASKLMPSKVKNTTPVRLPRSSGFGAQEKMVWGILMLNNEKHYLHRRFFADVAAADAQLAE